MLSVCTLKTPVFQPSVGGEYLKTHPLELSFQMVRLDPMFVLVKFLTMMEPFECALRLTVSLSFLLFAAEQKLDWLPVLASSIWRAQRSILKFQIVK